MTKLGQPVLRKTTHHDKHFKFGPLTQHNQLNIVQYAINRVTIFFRQRTGTVVFLREFLGDLRKKKGLHSSDARFLRIFE